ncbi:MAG: nucleotidyltransferase domain-containing protein [Syntrophothermus sp.]|uniref:nucleotidyltransferase domain-containing protein n=1 Tax=Syntrophothermus sp. TaxID=2736299 RepID=UPI00257E86AD|nr:nucleotidyltransferase domain-containing protein [Syntrophothermus sp.]NSW83934.1 nucleotidyltransferase domain-containing protein [Syntrophothermus sp.]
MDKSNLEIHKTIENFKKSLSKYGINVEKAFLYGSHAKGTAHQFSDIDLIVISPDFEGLNFKQRCEVLGRAIVEVMEPIEPLAYTPEEFAALELPSIGAMIANNQIEHIAV